MQTAQKKKNRYDFSIFSSFKQLIIPAIKYMKCMLGAWYKGGNDIRRNILANGFNGTDQY